MTQQQFRWGGVAAIAGSALFISVFVFVGAIVGVDASIDAFPDIRAGRTIENGLYLAALILWIAPFLSLHQALRESSPAVTSYGAVLGVVGLTVLAAGALPHAASVPIADLYGAPGAASVDRAALAAVWQGNQAILTMLLVTGLAIVPLGVIGLGFAMMRSPMFGRGIARASVVLGVAGAAAAVALLADPGSPIAVVGFIALIAFQLVVGWRLIDLSRTRGVTAAHAAPVLGDA